MEIIGAPPMAQDVVVGDGPDTDTGPLLVRLGGRRPWPIEHLRGAISLTPQIIAATDQWRPDGVRVRHSVPSHPVAFEFTLSDRMVVREVRARAARQVGDDEAREAGEALIAAIGRLEANHRRLANAEARIEEIGTSAAAEYAIRIADILADPAAEVADAIERALLTIEDMIGERHHRP